MLLGPALLLAVALSVIAAGEAVVPGDVATARLVQATPEAIVGDVVRLVNAIGETPTMIAIVAVAALALLTLRRPGDAVFLLLAAAGVRLVNLGLKASFESPRPTPAQIRVEEVSSGFGFPSGHAMGMAVVVGAAAWLAWEAFPRRRARVATLTVAGSVLLVSGFGRVYVGAHWPSDVLGAYLWGSVGLIVLVWSRVSSPIRLCRRETGRWPVVVLSVGGPAGPPSAPRSRSVGRS